MAVVVMVACDAVSGCCRVVMMVVGQLRRLLQVLSIVGYLSSLCHVMRGRRLLHVELLLILLVLLLACRY